MMDPPHNGSKMEPRKSPGSTLVEMPRELELDELDEQGRVYGSRWVEVEDAVPARADRQDVATLEREEGGAVTLADLYESYCASWFDKSDFRLTLTREHKVALVEYLARLLWNVPEQKVHYQTLFERSTEFFRDQPLTPYDKEKIDYEVRTALFLHRDPEGHYRFIHRSFLEFFVARTLRAGVASLDSACLDLNPLTREVVFFLGFWPEAAQIPELASRVLEGPYARRVSENALRLLYFHCRSQVAPMVGPGADQVPEEAVAELREIFQGRRPRRFELRGAELSRAELRGADLSGAQLEAARLDGTDLRDAVLDRAELTAVSLASADVRGASFAEARLKYSNNSCMIDKIVPYHHSVAGRRSRGMDGGSRRASL